MSLFRYADEWLENPQSFAIAPGLPRDSAGFHRSATVDQHGALPGPVADSAPDTWGRGLIRKANAAP